MSHLNLGLYRFYIPVTYEELLNEMHEMFIASKLMYAHPAIQSLHTTLSFYLFLITIETKNLLYG